jgi:hypothetical protein
VGIAITIFLGVVPMNWWSKTLLVVLLGVLAGDISFHAPWFQLWSSISKAVIWIISIVIIVTLTWGPIHEQYKMDQLPASVAELQRFGQELIDLSSDILAVTADRGQQAPPRFVNGRDSHEAWAAAMRYENETANMVTQRFGGRIMSKIALLKVMGINAPWIVQSSIDPSKIGQWLGAMGHLIAEGRFQDAVTSGSDEKLWFGLLK